MAASWECPSLPMLSLPLKETAKTSFLALKPLISAHYEENPNTFSDEIRQLDQLRENATHPTRDYNGCSIIRRYFAQLHLLRARFPPETVGQIPVDFAWKDTYSGVEYIQEGFQIEQASVLYNIAALHAQLGCHGKRDTEQEMKEAVTHFQCSAGALTYLDEHFAINHASKDLSTEFVSFYHSLMLGQAQECLVEKSLKGIGRVKNATISRLATRVSEYYSRCVGLLEGSACSVMAKKHKDWPKLLKFKILYYQAIAHFYQGAHAEEMGKYGELIALTQLTVQKLNSISGKPPKGMGDLMKISRQNFAEHVTNKLAIAKRQNEQVYHDNVPQVETLELMSGADLVKPVSFHPNDPKNQGTDIFSRLIPMRAHEVASIYSEEKAKLMRSVMSSVEEKDEELEQYMKSLNANEVEKIHKGPPDIPSNVLELHRSLEGKGDIIRELHMSWQGLLLMSRYTSEDIAAIDEMKKTEEEEESTFQREYGVRPPSQVCTALWQELESYRKYHTQAVRLQGSGFYDKLGTSMTRLKTRVEEVCDARKRERASIQRRTPETTPPTSPPSVPQPTTTAPVRPPKKAELTGKPLHPDQQILSHPPNDSTAGPGGTLDVPFSAHSTPTQVDLQELQRVQKQQQALLEGAKSPPPFGQPPLGVPQSDNVPSQMQSVEHPSVQQETSVTPQDQQLTSFSVPVTDATQALNSLQMLVNPVAPPMPMAAPPPESGGDTTNFPTPDPSQVPERPPKPSHLKSGVLPSPFPALPILDGQSSTLPQDSLMEPIQPSGPVPAETVVDSGGPPLNTYPGVTPSSVVLPEASVATTDPQSNILNGQQLPPISPPLQPPSTASSPSLLVAQTAVGASNSSEDVLYSDATLPSSQQPPIMPTTVAPTPLNQPSVQDGVQSQDQPPVAADPAQSSFYQSNINIQPGQITVATSSILGPIPSTLAVPVTTQTVVPPLTTPPPAPTVSVTSVPSVQPTNLEPLPQATSQLGVESSDVVNGSITVAAEYAVVNTPSTYGPIQPQSALPTQPHYALSEGRTTDAMDVPSIGVNGQECGEVHVHVSSQNPREANGQISDLQAPPPHQPPWASSSGMLTQPMLLGASPDPTMSLSGSGAGMTSTSTSVSEQPLDLSASHSSVLPLPVTSLTVPPSLQAPVYTTPFTTELLTEGLAPTKGAQPMDTVQIQLLQQSLEDQKQAIEIHRNEREAFKVQEVAYQQQIMQLQQQLSMLQQKQDQEKAAATDQQSALMQLLHQQQGMFSQQQSQMEKLSQQDESHRKEYLHVEEKFREMLRVEQEMKSSLQNQIMQLTQENQKLNQAMQTQAQQMQALQLQLQQYSVHIQERDKQLIAFKDQHKEIVEKLEQKSQQKVAQLVRRIQELQLELNQRREGAPSLPQPLQPTVIHPLNVQQRQDLGPSSLQPNLPQPIRPMPPPPRPLQQHSGGVQSSSSVHPGSVQRPVAAPSQGIPGVGRVILAETKTPNPLQARPPSSQALQAPSVPVLVHSQSVWPQGHSSVPAAAGQPASPMTVPPPGAHQLQPQQSMIVLPGGSSDGTASPLTPQPHVQQGMGQVRLAGIPSQPLPSTPNMQSSPQISSPRPQVHTSKVPTFTPPNAAINVRPTSMQAQAPFAISNMPQPHQTEQQRVLPHQQHHQPPTGFHPPSEHQHVHPQQVVPQSMRPDIPSMQPIMMGQRFPVQGGPMMRPNFVQGPGTMTMQSLPPVSQVSYGDGSRTPGPQQPQYRGHVP